VLENEVCLVYPWWKTNSERGVDGEEGGSSLFSGINTDLLSESEDKVSPI